MKQCGHGACTCRIEGTIDHCGPTCRTGITDNGEACKCGHATCSETIGEASLR